MFGLNVDVSLIIFNYLDVFEAVSCSGIDKKSNHFINTHPQIWTGFACDRQINLTYQSDPKELLKQFYKISLGKDEDEIKRTWSYTLRKKIRKVPYYEEKIKYLPFSSLDVMDLNNVKGLMRFPNPGNTFMLLYINKTNNIIVKEIYRSESLVGEKLPSIVCREETYKKTADNQCQLHGAIIHNTIETNKLKSPTISQVIEHVIDESGFKV